jgi:hypothetical protein
LVFACSTSGAISLLANSVVQSGSNDKAAIRVGTRASNGDYFWVSLRTNAVTRPASYDTCVGGGRGCARVLLG